MRDLGRVDELSEPHEYNQIKQPHALKNIDPKHIFSTPSGSKLDNEVVVNPRSQKNYDWLTSNLPKFTAR